MYDENKLDNFFDKKEALIDDNHNIDSLFDNLTEDIANVNKIISQVTRQQKDNQTEEKELSAEKEKLEKMKNEFSNYIKIQEEKIKANKAQSEQYILEQYNKLRKSEEEFKNNISKNFTELEIEKKSLEIEKEKFEQQKQQFESYKVLETNRIKQIETSVNADKEQFEKYKDISMKKIEFENKNLEQKCLKFKEIMKQFNLNFKPIKELEEE